MRKYQPIWNKLKAEGSIQVTSPYSSHRTIVQALKKESALDAAFRFKCVEEGKYYFIRTYSAGDVLYLELQYQVGVRKGFL